MGVSVIGMNDPRCTCEPEHRDCPAVYQPDCPLHGHPDEGGGYVPLGGEPRWDRWDDRGDR